MLLTSLRNSTTFGSEIFIVYFVGEVLQSRRRTYIPIRVCQSELRHSPKITTLCIRIGSQFILIVLYALVFFIRTSLGRAKKTLVPKRRHSKPRRPHGFHNNFTAVFVESSFCRSLPTLYSRPKTMHSMTSLTLLTP